MAYQPKSYKKFVATAATATLVATAVAPTALAADFTDVNANYKNAVDYLVDQGITQGLTETTFGVTSPIKRGDAAIMIAKALGLNTTTAPDAGFTDVNARVAGAVNAIVAAGIASGKTSTTFAPDLYITRQETAKIIANAYGLTGSGTTKFADVNSNWAPFVSALEEAGIAQGLNETTFGATNDVTRGQFALFLYRAEGQPYEVATVESLMFNAEGNEFTLKFAEALPEDADLAYVLENYTVLVNGSAPSAATVEALKLMIKNVSADRKTVVVSHTDLDTLAPALGGTSVTLSIGGKSDAYTFDLEAKVNSVTSLNAKQIEVKFNTAVSEASVLNSSDEVQNITFTGVGSFANPGTLTGELSADGKTLTITASNIFDGQYAFRSTDDIVTTTGEELPVFTTILTVDDSVAPKLLSATASARTSTNSIALFFDEPVSASGAIVYVNGVAGTITNNATNPNRLDVTASNSIAAGSTVSVSVTNVKDYNENFISPNPLTTSVTVTADTVAPTVASVTVIGENQLQVKYNKPMNVSSFANKARLVNSAGTVTPLTATAGSDSSTVILTAAGLSYTTSYTGLLFIDEGVQDTAGNNAAAYSSSVTFNKDVVAPVLTGVKFENGQIVATFSEDVAAGSNATVTAINQATGVATNITLNYTPTTGNAVIDDNTLTITQAFSNGTYQLRLPANTVVDTAGVPNPNAIATQNFVVTNTTATDNVRPTVSSISNGTAVPTTGTAPGVEQTVTYTAADAGTGIDLATVRNLNNYTWDGKALPAGSYVTTAITGTADKATSVVVTVHIPSSEVATTKSAQFTVSNVRDNAGNTIASVATAPVTLADGVKPAFNSATIAANGTSLVLGFSEATNNVDADDFVITLNGTVVPAANLGTVAASNTEINKYVTSISASVANDATTNGGTSAAPKDIVFIDADSTTGLSSGDIILRVLDASTYSTDSTITVDLSASYVNGLKVKLVSETGNQVTDVQGNTAVFNNEITVK